MPTHHQRPALNPWPQPQSARPAHHIQRVAQQPHPRKVFGTSHGLPCRSIGSSTYCGALRGTALPGMTGPLGSALGRAAMTRGSVRSPVAPRRRRHPTWRPVAVWARSDEPVQAADQVTLPLLYLCSTRTSQAWRPRVILLFRALLAGPLGLNRRGPVIIAAVDRMALRPWSAGAEITAWCGCQQAG